MLSLWGTTPTPIEGWAPAHESTFISQLSQFDKLPFSLILNAWNPMVAGGVYSVSMSLSLIHLFAHRFNFSAPKLTYLNQAQYGVYILHPLIWTFFAWLFITVYEAFGGQ